MQSLKERKNNEVVVYSSPNCDPRNLHPDLNSAGKSWTTIAMQEYLVRGEGPGLCVHSAVRSSSAVS